MPRTRRAEPDGPVVPRGAAGMSVGVVVALVALVLVYKRQVHDQLPAQRVDEAIAVLAFEEPPDATARAHEDVLAVGADAVPKLLVALKAEETERPEEIVEALARIGEDSVAPELRPYVQHVDARVRAAAIEALVSFGDASVEPELRRLADDDPTLGVRQLAVIGLADLGARDVDRDLAAILDPTSILERRESADGSLEVSTGRSFGLDRARAEEWLDANGSPAAATSVGGRGRADGEPLVFEDGDVHVRVDRSGAWLTCRVRGATAPFHLALETANGRILLAVDATEDGLAASAEDLPAEGRSLPRHDALDVEPHDGDLVVRLPRVGHLVSSDEPKALRVIR